MTGDDATWSMGDWNWDPNTLSASHKGTAPPCPPRACQAPHGMAAAPMQQHHMLGQGQEHGVMQQACHQQQQPAGMVENVHCHPMPATFLQHHFQGFQPSPFGLPAQQGMLSAPPIMRASSAVVNDGESSDGLKEEASGAAGQKRPKVDPELDAAIKSGVISISDKPPADGEVR